MVFKQPISIYTKFLNWYRNLWIPLPGNPPYNHICLIGDPILRGKTQTVDLDKINSQEIKNILNKMKSVMNKSDAIGLSAPQIGCPMKIIAMQFTEKIFSQFPPHIVETRQIQVFPYKVFINPVMTVINNSKISFPESCASIGGYSATVPRYLEVKLTGYDENSKEISWQIKGWPARIIQHEMDHLSGKLYTDIMEPKTLVYEYWYYENVRRSRYFIRIKPMKFKHKHLN